MHAHTHTSMFTCTHTYTQVIQWTTNNTQSFKIKQEIFFSNGFHVCVCVSVSVFIMIKKTAEHIHKHWSADPMSSPTTALHDTVVIVWKGKAHFWSNCLEEWVCSWSFYGKYFPWRKVHSLDKSKRKWLYASLFYCANKTVLKSTANFVL